LGWQERSPRTAAQKVSTLVPHRRQQDQPGAAAIPQAQVVGLELNCLLPGQVHFAHRAGFQAGVQCQLIEQVVEHAHPGFRVTGAGGSALISHRLGAEDAQEGGGGRQAQRGTVHPQQAMPLPGTPLSGLCGRISQGQQHVLIKFHEGRVFELGAGLGPGPCHDGGHARFGEPGGEELAPMALDRLAGFLGEEQQHGRKSQAALAGEVTGATPVPGHEVGIAQAGAQLVDQRHQVIWNSRQGCLHGHSLYTS
jgi:hypothetical protein